MWCKCLNENKEKKSLSNLLARHISPHAERLGRCSESLTNSTALVTGEENKKAPKPSFSHLVTSRPIMKQAFSFSPNFGGYNKLHPGASLPSKENLLPIPNLSMCLFPGFPQSGGLLTASLPASPCPPKAHGHTHWGLSARVLLVLESCREAAFLPLLHRSLCGRVCGTHRETDAKAPSPVSPCPFLWASEDSRSLALSPTEKRGASLNASTDVSPTLLKAVIFQSQAWTMTPTSAGQVALR